MSIFQWLKGQGASDDVTSPAAEIRASGPAVFPADISQTSNHQEWSEIFSSGILGAGVPVNEHTAMRVTAVYACIGLIGGAVASMPLNFYQRKDDGREKITHDLWWLLNEQPNPRLSAAVFWEYLVTSLLLHGDAFAKIIRPTRLSPKISGFEPLHPLAVTVRCHEDRLIYTINRTGGGVEVLDQDDMLHIPNIGFDGLRGLSTLRSALLTSAGIAISADQYSADFFKNGARPDFIISSKGKVTPEQAETIRTTWAQRHTGIGNHHLPAVLQGEMDVKQLTMNSDDAQLLSVRGFGVEEIARIFGVPPFMIGHNEKTTSWGSGIESLGIGFVKYSLMKLLVKFQQEINRKCFRTQTYFCEFLTAGLERGDLKSRYDAHRIGLGRAGEPGWLTTNEVRKIENMPPIDGGDVLYKGDKGIAKDAASTQASS